MWNSSALAAKWIPVLNAAEQKYGIPHDLLARQCYEESRFNPTAKNAHSGATGIMQLLPRYFPGAGESPVKDINTGAQYLASLAKRFGGDWQLALAAYDWGPGSVSSWLKAGAPFAEMPTETQIYVSEITADVPITGVLVACKIPNPPPVGNPPAQSSAAVSSAPPSPSLLSRVSSIFSKSKSIPSSVVPSPPSVLLQPPISSQTDQGALKMSVTPATPAVSAQQQILNLILSDLLSTGGTPLLTFLAAFGAAGGDPAKITAAWIAFQGAEIGQLPALELTLSQQLAAFLTSKVQALMAKV